MEKNFAPHITVMLEGRPHEHCDHFRHGYQITAEEKENFWKTNPALAVLASAVVNEWRCVCGATKIHATHGADSAAQAWTDWREPSVQQMEKSLLDAEVSLEKAGELAHRYARG